MKTRIYWTGAALVASYLRTSSCSQLWRLRSKPVCSSTEIDLSRWLKENPSLNGQPRACLANRQAFGKGQYGRRWDSPAGGIWLSAAMPWDVPMKHSGLFGLAVAVSVANTLQKNSVPVKLKWPNDLMVEERKLAGFLPKIVSRGKMIKYARVGIGINARNRVSTKAISLAQVFNQKNISLSEWTAKILISLEQAIYLMKDNQSLCRQADKLLLKTYFHESETGKRWKIKCINNDGSLMISRGWESKSLYHWA